MSPCREPLIIHVENLPASALPFRMPAEWEPHEATWLAWPHHCGDWPGKFPLISWVFTEIVRHLHHGEKVYLLVDDAKAEMAARRMLKHNAVDLDHVRFFIVPTDRVWIRDYGPILAKTAAGSRTLLHWLFCAWAKYDDWALDTAVPEKLAPELKLPLKKPKHRRKRVVLEGGSIDVDGRGTLITTEECLLSDIQERNPGLLREDYEAIFAEYLGVTRVLWLGNGIVGDDTHGHVDDLARFVAPGKVVLAIETNRADPNYRPLQENLDRLRGEKDAMGQKLEVIPLPMPAPVVFAGQRLPASYANFYIANGKVLVPTFNDVQDRNALGILAECFPDRDVVGIHALDLVWGLGTLHCMTQQLPG
jgi:agmatine deiminase